MYIITIKQSWEYKTDKAATWTYAEGNTTIDIAPDTGNVYARVPTKLKFVVPRNKWFKTTLNGVSSIWVKTGASGVAFTYPALYNPTIEINDVNNGSGTLLIPTPIAPSSVKIIPLADYDGINRSSYYKPLTADDFYMNDEGIKVKSDVGSVQYYTKSYNKLSKTYDEKWTTRTDSINKTMLATCVGGDNLKFTIRRAGTNDYYPSEAQTFEYEVLRTAIIANYANVSNKLAAVDGAYISDYIPFNSDDQGTVASNQKLINAWYKSYCKIKKEDWDNDDTGKVSWYKISGNKYSSAGYYDIMSERSVTEDYVILFSIETNTVNNAQNSSIKNILAIKNFAQLHGVDIASDSFSDGVIMGKWLKAFTSNNIVAQLQNYNMQEYSAGKEATANYKIFNADKFVVTNSKVSLPAVNTKLEYKAANSLEDWTTVNSATDLSFTMKPWKQTFWVRIPFGYDANDAAIYSASRILTINVPQLMLGATTPMFSASGGKVTLPKNIEYRLGSTGNTEYTSTRTPIDITSLNCDYIQYRRPAVASFAVPKGYYYLVVPQGSQPKKENKIDDAIPLPVDGLAATIYNDTGFKKVNRNTTVNFDTTIEVPIIYIAREAQFSSNMAGYFAVSPLCYGAVTVSGKNKLTISPASDWKTFSFSHLQNSKQPLAEELYATPTGFAVEGGKSISYLKAVTATKAGRYTVAMAEEAKKVGKTVGDDFAKGAVVGHVWMNATAVSLAQIKLNPYRTLLPDDSYSDQHTNSTTGGNLFCVYLRAAPTLYNTPGKAYCIVFDDNGLFVADENSITPASPASIISNYQQFALDMNIVDNEEDVYGVETDEDAEPLKGDLNGNGVIDSLDYLALKIYILEPDDYGFDPYLADMDDDLEFTDSDIELLYKSLKT
ncbi:hypothetical protein FACS1894132_13440 [Clostridia bacterium]|nr:hypothetical protein FACS1894132_13440 [Clostridia bacterium]